MIDFTLTIAVTVVAIGAILVSRNRDLIAALGSETRDPQVADRRLAVQRKYRVNAVGLAAAVVALVVYVLSVLVVFEEVDQTLNAVILSVLIFFPYAIAAAFVYGIYAFLVSLLGR